MARKQGKTPRKSLSVRAAVFDRFQAHAETIDRSISSLVEGYMLAIVGEPPTVAAPAPAPKRAPVPGARVYQSPPASSALQIVRTKRKAGGFQILSRADTIAADTRNRERRTVIEKPRTVASEEARPASSRVALVTRPRSIGDGF